MKAIAIGLAALIAMANSDVDAVGYRAVGMVMGALLGKLRHSVVVLERHAGRYKHPQAATFDDETMRTLAVKVAPTNDANQSGQRGTDR